MAARATGSPKLARLATEPILLETDLPDAPGAVATAGRGMSSSLAIAETFEHPGRTLDRNSRLPQPGQPPSPLHAQSTRVSPLDTVIAPGEAAPPQTSRDKVLSSLLDTVSPVGFVGDLASTEYSLLTNGRPNYGSNASAFPQRLGATVARATSQKLLYEGVMAPLLHQDARFYQLGSERSFLKRVVYAGTRPVIGRTDTGHTTPNLALIGGYLGSAALTQAYYPAPNQGGSEVLKIWGTSIGGAALGDVVTEFLPDALELLHVKKR